MSEVSTKPAGSLIKKMSPIEWVVLISAGLGVLLFLRYRKAQQAATAQNDQTALLDQLSGTGGLAGLLAGGNQNPTGSTAQTTSGAPLDNESWASQATSSLLKHGGYSPLDINQAFANFLSGQPLSQLQQQIINQAETLLGAPPLSVPNIQIAPPPEANKVPTAADFLDPVLKAIKDLVPAPAPAPAPAAPAPSPAPMTGPLSVMDQGTYLGAVGADNWATFSQAGGYLDKFFTNPNQYQIIGGNGTPATTSQVLADLQARGLQVKPNWQPIN